MKKYITGILLVFILPLFSESKHILNLTDATFHREVLESKETVLVDFWAPWCSPCRILSPIIEDLAEENYLEMKFTKLNVQDNQRIAAAYGIRSIPTVGIFVGGKPVDGFIGLRKKEEILEIIKKHFKSSKKPAPAPEKQPVKEKSPAGDEKSGH